MDPGIKIPCLRFLINKRNLFVSVLETRKSKIKVATDLVSGSQRAAYSVSSHGGS